MSNYIKWTPILSKVVNKHPVILGVILFDGTGSDRLHLDKKTHETIEGHIYDKLINRKHDIFHYYAGPGTESMWIQSAIDKATGYSVKSTSINASRQVIYEINKLREAQPNAEVRLFVSGFSRGAAAARDFMNEIQKYWENKGEISISPTFYAVLFDTVSTGQTHNLLLGVPLRADIFYHFISEDERRLFYRLVVDNPENDIDGRVVTIPLPGAHSDIGASYNTGIGREYIAHTDALLSAMGLSAPGCQDVAGDARLEGKHNSLGLLEHIIGIRPPNTSIIPMKRRIWIVPTTPMSDYYRRDWKGRIENLQLENNYSLPFCVNRSNLSMLRFVIRKLKSGFQISSQNPPNIPLLSINYDNNKYLITFYLDGITRSHIYIPNLILEKIPENGIITLDINVTVDENSRPAFCFISNDILFSCQ